MQGASLKGSAPSLGLIASACGGVELILDQLITPFVDRGWTVGVTLTPTAGVWLAASGGRDKIEQATGLPVRVEARLPGETSPHPMALP